MKKSQQYDYEEFKLKILSLPIDFGACGWMRVRSPFKEFTDRGLADAQILVLNSLSEDQLKKTLAAADVIVVKPGAERLMVEAKKMYPFKRFIADFDDDVFSVQPSSEHYRDYGPNDVDVKLPNGETRALWKTGLDGFAKFRNRHRILDVQQMLETADAVTAVTRRLADYLSSRAEGRPVYYVPNAINLKLYPDIEVKDPKKGKEFRVGFCGGMSHYGDLEMVADKLISWIKKDKNRKLYFVGHKFDRFKELGDQVRYEPWLAFEANSYRMKSLGLDVLIAPLAETDFNIRKDPLKFWDAAGLSLPLVASNVPPFSDVIEDGKTGFLFKEPKDMVKILEKLQKNPSLGKEVGKNARKFIESSDHNLKNLAPKMAELYKQIAKSPVRK